MKIFLSYPSVRRDVAERLKLALEAEGHEVFYDRDDLPPGQTFHREIREAVEDAELFIFLITPESVAPGSYTLTELGLVEQRWPRPAGRLLPVIVTETPRDRIPAYLLAVTLLQPRGEVVAETVARVARMASPGLKKWVVIGAIASLLVVAAIAYVGVQQAAARSEAAARTAMQKQLTTDAARALELCQGGSYQEAFAELTKIGAMPDAPSQARVAREDCAMAWLRKGRVTVGHTTFEQLVAPLKPVLAQALVAGASGPRAGDLHAHLGWADALIRLDGKTVSVDPESSFRRSVEVDPRNVYGHAMWANWMLRRGSSQQSEALKHFEIALAERRDVAFVRNLQLGMMITSEGLAAEALRVLNEMRKRGETLDPQHKPRVWSYLYARAYREPEGRRLTEAVPPTEALDTFRWLFSRNDLDASQQPLWRYVEGLLLARSGHSEEARPDLEALRRELQASRSEGPLFDAVVALLARK